MACTTATMSLKILLRGVYSDTTQLNSTDPVEQRTAKSVVFLFMTSCTTYIQTESTESLRSLIGDSCSRCERVDNSTSNLVELSRVASASL